MRDYKSLAEWLEAKGNPRNSIAPSDDGNMAIADEHENGMKFVAGKYYSLDKHTLCVYGRVEITKTGGRIFPRIYASVGVSKPAYYKIKHMSNGREFAIAKGHFFSS